MGSRVDVKVVLLGMAYSGKTSLVERFLHGRFNPSIPYQNTIGAAFGAKKMMIGNRILTLGIWDTAGSERYEAMSRIYYRGARAAVVCYDLTDATSFARAKFWVNELTTCEEKCKIYLCGTKYDMIEKDKKSRKVDYYTTTDYADEINAKVLETSSLTGQNIEELFQMITEDFVKDESPFPSHADGQNVNLQENRSQARWCCS